MTDKPAAPAPDDWVGEAENLPEPLGLPPGDPTLPMLPEPRLIRKESSDTTGTWVTQLVSYFTAGQVTDYARAARAPLLDAIDKARMVNGLLTTRAEKAEAEIEQLKQAAPAPSDWIPTGDCSANGEPLYTAAPAPVDKSANLQGSQGDKSSVLQGQGDKSPDLQEAAIFSPRYVAEVERVSRHALDVIRRLERAEQERDEWKNKAATEFAIACEQTKRAERAEQEAAAPAPDVVDDKWDAIVRKAYEDEPEPDAIGERKAYEAWYTKKYGSPPGGGWTVAWDAWQARATHPAAPAPYCDCPPNECHGKGINECRWELMRKAGWSNATAAPAPDAATVKDAERYRWLRAASVDRGCIPYDDWWERLGDKLDDDFDTAIDAAMKEGK